LLYAQRYERRAVSGVTRTIINQTHNGKIKVPLPFFLPLQAIIMKVLLAKDITSRFQISLSTLYRWNVASKAGTGTFPLPISEPGKQLRWNAADIENWADCRNQRVPSVQTESAAQRYQRNNAAVEYLRSKGVRVSAKSQENNVRRNDTPTMATDAHCNATYRLVKRQAKSASNT